MFRILSYVMFEKYNKIGLELYKVLSILSKEIITDKINDGARVYRLLLS